MFELDKAAGGTAAILFVSGLLNCRIQAALADRRDRHPLPRGHQCSIEIIAQTVWFRLRFPLSLWIPGDRLTASVIIVSHQAIRL